MKISVIVPVYNVERFLKPCLNSILGQSYSDLEIILVNDGSTDHSGSICEQFAMQDARIKVIHQANGGVSSARNIGIKEATGEYITFVDSDDWLSVNMYQEMVMAASENNHPDVLMCDLINARENGSERITANIRAGFYDRKDIVQDLYPTLLVTEDLGRLPIISVCSCFFKKNLLCDNLVAFETELRYSEDYLFMAAVMVHAKSFFYLKEHYLYHYRQYDASRSKKYQPQWWDNLKFLNLKLEELLRSNKDYDFQKQIKWQLIHSLLLVSGKISQDKKLGNRDKIRFLQKLYNEHIVTEALRDLEVRNKKFGLKVVLFLIRNKMAVGYLAYSKLRS